MYLRNITIEFLSNFYILIIFLRSIVDLIKIERFWIFVQKKKNFEKYYCSSYSSHVK